MEAVAFSREEEKGQGRPRIRVSETVQGTTALPSYL
jgi:hypothetical protein